MMLYRRCRPAERTRLERQKDQIIADKDAEIEQLKLRMEDMSAEYLDMLKQTLDRIGNKIESESMGLGATDSELASKLAEFKLGFADI